MRDSDFWHDLADKFRALDIHGQHLWASWSADLSNAGVAGPTHWILMTEGDAGHNAKVLFEPLASRAAARLGKVGSLAELWIEEIKGFHGGDSSGSGFKTAPDGTKVEHIGGTIMRLCPVAAELCSHLEKVSLENEQRAKQPAPALTPVSIHVAQPKAHLSAEALERVQLDQHAVNLRYWPEIGSMKVTALDGIAAVAVLGRTPVPIMPKAPIKLFGILGRYAVASFNCEYAQYPQEHAISWAFELTNRIIEIVIKNVEFIDGHDSPGAKYHATYEEMAGAIRRAVNDHVQQLSKSISVDVVLPPLPALTTGDLQQRPSTQPKSLGERLDDAAIASGHKEVWGAIGMSKSTYFEVKAGRGGKKAKIKAELYLSRLESKATTNLD